MPAAMPPFRHVMRYDAALRARAISFSAGYADISAFTLDFSLPLRGADTMLMPARYAGIVGARRYTRVVLYAILYRYFDACFHRFRLC